MSGKQFRSKLRKAGTKTGKCLQKAAWQGCKCVLWTCCAPCLCIVMLCLPRRHRGCVRHGKPVEYARPALPFPRERALTIPSTDWQESQFTLDQPQSSFMTKLPLEIRRMVYEQALGGASIHLTTVDGGLLARRCGHAECRCGIRDTSQEKKLDFALAILRTCRQIYSEAVEYLYTANSFSLSTDREEHPTIDYLSYYFLPQRLTQIRDLRFYWELDSYHYVPMIQMPDPVLDQWFKSWDSLSKLTGLRRLHITLDSRFGIFSDYYSELWKERSTELLEPIKKITAPQKFTVLLPDRTCLTAVDVGDSKCVLELPSAGDDEEADPDDGPG